MTTMEADLAGIMTEAKTVDVELNSCDESDIVGMLVLDERGLVVGQHGEVEQGLGGVVQNLISQSAKIPSEDGEHPVIVINSDNRKYLIKREDKITTAIVKKL